MVNLLPSSANAERAERWLAEQIQQQDPDLLRSMTGDHGRMSVSTEADTLCGTGCGERSDERINRRNGYRTREWDTHASTVELAIPELRSGSYFPTGYWNADGGLSKR